jgi:hypothetical protein
VNNIIVWLLGALLALITGWGGLQKHNVSKAVSRAEKAECRARKAEQGLQASQITNKTKDEILADQKANREKKESVDLQISETEKKEDTDEKRKNQERIANGITDLFNARNHSL